MAITYGWIKKNHQVSLAQTLDSALRLLNRYPVDKYQGNQLYYPLDRDLSSGYNNNNNNQALLTDHFIKNALPVSRLHNKIFRETTLILKYIYILIQSIL